MKAHITDCRVGRPTWERPYARFVTLEAKNACSEQEWGHDCVLLVLDEEEAKKLHRWLSRCLAELEANAVDVSFAEAGATLPIAARTADADTLRQQLQDKITHTESLAFQLEAVKAERDQLRAEKGEKL